MRQHEFNALSSSRTPGTTQDYWSKLQWNSKDDAKTFKWVEVVYLKWCGATSMSESRACEITQDRHIEQQWDSWTNTESPSEQQLDTWEDADPAQWEIGGHIRLHDATTVSESDAPGMMWINSREQQCNTKGDEELQQLAAVWQIERCIDAPVCGSETPTTNHSCPSELSGIHGKTQSHPN